MNRLRTELKAADEIMCAPDCGDIIRARVELAIVGLRAGMFRLLSDPTFRGASPLLRALDACEAFLAAPSTSQFSAHPTTNPKQGEDA